jgi:CDP-glycerol glycerophosphotransferase (TagB/SpsB family)
LVYIPHHEEIDLGKNYSQNIFKFAKIKGQKDLENEIELCNLFITDYSSISFDFMFQNKPVLYYTIDKSYNNSNDTLFLGIIFQI